jgi:hypothetical protein
MKKFFIVFLLIPVIAKSQYRFAFKLSNIYSSAYFESNNSTNFLDDDPLTRGDVWQGYRIKRENTLDWPEAASTSFLTDIGRRYSLELSIERKMNKNLYLSTGFEVGSRFFSVESKYIYQINDNNDNYRPMIYRSYRNFSIPISAAYNLKLNNRFSLKPNAGFSINMPESFTQETFPGIYFVKAFSPIYFMLTIGAEVNYNFKKGNGIALTATYSQGFTNIIKDYISDQRAINDSIWDVSVGGDSVKIRYDKSYDNKVVVASNGSNFSIGIKYYFLPFGTSTNKLNNKVDFSKIDFTTRQLNSMIDMKLDTNYIKVCVWDDQRIDGDSVAMEYKDSLILNNVRLEKTPQCAWIKIEHNQSNYLLIHALNEGRIKPNTIKLMVYNKDKTIEQTIKTDLQKSGVVNFTLE